MFSLAFVEIETQAESTSKGITKVRSFRFYKRSRVESADKGTVWDKSRGSLKNCDMKIKTIKRATRKERKGRTISLSIALTRD